MKYYNKTIGLLIIFIMSMTGCVDELNLINPNELSSKSLTTSESDLNLQLMGCYDGLQQNFYYRRYLRETDALAGTCYWGGGLALSQGFSTPETDTYREFWVALYTTAVRCNNLIANIDDAKTTDKKAIEIKAEAMVLRALSYFHIMAFYKDAPFIAHKQTFDERNVSVDPEAKLKAGILSDLDFAIVNLPVDQPQGKVGKAAAMALKMRTHQYFNEMTEVAAITQQIVGLNKYELFSDYTQLFTEANEKNKESLFSVAFASGIGEGEWFSGSFALQPVTMSVRPLQPYTDMFYCTDGLPTGKPTLIDTPLKGKVSPLYSATKFYENRDPRYDATILRIGEKVPNGSAWVATRSPTGYAVEKYWRKTTTEYGADGPVDFMVFRYAEVLLSRAEALLTTQGVIPEVYSLVNQVRARVKMPTIQSVEEAIKGSAINAQEMLQVIKNERFVELGVEGILWFDVKRWGDVEKINQVITANVAVDPRPFKGDQTISWPIPQVEIDNNPNLTQHSWWIGGN